MASDFKCTVDPPITVGSAQIEVQTCDEVGGENPPRKIEIDRVTFSPDKLSLIDINAKRQFLISKYHGDKSNILSKLSGIFKSTDGGTATQALAMPEFSNLAVVTGGIYFAGVDQSWPELGQTTKQADGFVWFKPDPKKDGRVLSAQHGNFTSGGYLLIDFDGNASLRRFNEFSPNTASAAELDHHRLIIESNIILVADGKEDGNNDSDKNAVAALSVQNDGKLELFVAHEPGKSSNGAGLTRKEFGKILADSGSRYALNLDGGPSAQFAIKKTECSNPKDPSTCVEKAEDQVDFSDATNPMPQLIGVEK